MLKSLFLAAILGCLTIAASNPAQAASAEHLKVVKSIKIAASPDKVWGIIQNFSDLTWHPAIKSSSATDGNNKGSVRTLDLGGPKLIEQLVRYDAKGMSYAYKITSDPNNVKTVPVTHYSSTISVKAAKSGSIVTWRGSFMRGDPAATPATGMDDAAATKAVTGIYESGLDALKKKAEAS